MGNSKYKQSKESKLRERREAAIGVLYGIRNLPAYLTLFEYLDLELEISKDRALDLTGDDLLQEIGAAKKLRSILETLRNPRRPERQR